MSCRKRIDFKKSKICSGDLNKKITIQYRQRIESNSANSISTMGFVDVGTFWAAVKTTVSKEPFDKVNLGEAITTDFFIRYSANIDIQKEVWIQYNCRNFKVINIENLNEDNLILRFRSVDRGSITKEASDI